MAFKSVLQGVMIGAERDNCHKNIKTQSEGHMYKEKSPLMKNLKLRNHQKRLFIILLIKKSHCQWVWKMDQRLGKTLKI